MNVFLRVVLVLINSLLLLSLVPWPFVLFGYMFSFSAVGSNPITIALLLAIIGHPVLVIAGCIGFAKHLRASPKRSLRYTLLGLASPAIILCVFLASQLFCDGQFACG